MTGSRVAASETPPPDDSETNAGLTAVLDYLKRRRGFDFTAYKRSSLLRRVRVRMQMVAVPDLATYLDRLRVDPDEFIRLFHTLLINVTSFFRDPTAWDRLRDEIVPRLMGPADSTRPIRAWSAGCASGEEAYSLAMLLAEALGPEAFRARVRIYATDVDEEAVAQARHAVYGTRAAEEIPAPLLEKYFVRLDDTYHLDQELRRAVIFGRHDLLQDAPIARVDLLTCRNCLMYFNPETQARILARFHFALVPSGVLFLGKAETLSQAATFEALDLQRRLFVRTERQPEMRHPTIAHDR